VASGAGADTIGPPLPSTNATHVSHACLTVERDFVAAWWLLAEAAGHELHDEPDLRWLHTGLPD
jgi:hypothetical protein